MTISRHLFFTYLLFLILYKQTQYFGQLLLRKQKENFRIANFYFSGKLFSIFSVVAFPNDECTTETNSVRGVCFSEDDCGTKGGTASGTCASGFGVCCLFK